jgi:lipopolysaccharide transport system permease protein
MAKILEFFFIPDLKKFPNLFRKLVYRDFFERFVGSALGFLWAILNPLVLMGMYVLLFSVILKIRFIEGGTHVDFGLYLFCGMIPWLAFQESLVKCSNIIFAYRNLILHIRLPLGFLPLHIAVSAVIQELIALVLFIGFVWQYKGLDVQGLPFLFLIVPIKILFTCGFNFFLTPITVFYRDIVQLVQIMMICWFFSSPIVYPISQVPGEYLSLYRLNPFVSFVECYRHAILGDPGWNWSSYLYVLGISLVLYILGFYYFKRSEKHILQYI